MVERYFAAIESGERSPDQLLFDYMRRIAKLEPTLHAWVDIAIRPGASDGPLRGLPFGVKDIFETPGMATEYGSRIYEGRKGEYLAHVVGDLLRAGGTLVGKTQTTAFASFDSAPTLNPRLPGHTPGGSSAGSAAAVAAGMIPFAVGTQTLGSVLRPASFCGVCGFKPTFGLLSMEGVLPFAPSLDTVGLFTESARDMASLWPRTFGARSDAGLRRAAWFRLACEPEMEAAIEDAVARLRAAGIAVDEVDVPQGWSRLVDAARTINTYEGARTHRERWGEYGNLIGVRLADLVRSGLAMSRDEYEAARAHITCMKVMLEPLLREYSAVLSPAAMGIAPSGFTSTGDPIHNAPWTALGVPAISVPMQHEAGPLGVQITAACGRDDALVAIGAMVERVLLDR